MAPSKDLRRLFSWIVLLQYALVCSTSLDEECIWRGSGLPRHDPPSVVSIESRCHQGELYWTDPFGGLRVTFNPRMKVQSEFKLCFTARHPGVRIYKEELESLTLLSEAGENVTRRAVCIKSEGERMPVVYLETQENQTLTQLNYTVLVNGRKRPRHGRPKECKPCKYSELLKSICKSDFVVRGFIQSIFPVGNGEKEQAYIIANDDTDIIRQEHSIFIRSSEAGGMFGSSVKVPGGCHWKQMGRRRMLLTGNLEAGQGPVLQCHIEEEVWVKLKKENLLHLCRVIHF